MNRPVKAAVVGVGYLGRFHAQKYAALDSCELVAVIDRDAERAQTVGRELGVEATTDLARVLPHVDAVSIAATTAAHFELGLQCLRAGKHTLIEKPLAATAEQTHELVQLAERQDVRLHVGHLERFNPVYQHARARIVKPRFIEAIRISSFLERGADVDVVLDLMSHDLDLIFDLVDSPLQQLHAVGLSLMTDSTDLANARLIFENGAVANLTASRISTKSERTMRIFQADAYFSLDFAAPLSKFYKSVAKHGSRRGEEKIPFEDALSEEEFAPDKGDALLAEISAFADTIRGEPPMGANGADGHRAVAVAQQVIDDIARNRQP